MKRQWAKLYYTDDHGQILVRRVRDRDEPAVTVTVTVDLDRLELGEAELSMGFTGEDAEAKADKMFDGMTEAKAVLLVEKGICDAMGEGL